MIRPQPDNRWTGALAVLGLTAPFFAIYGWVEDMSAGQVIVSSLVGGVGWAIGGAVGVKLFPPARVGDGPFDRFRFRRSPSAFVAVLAIVLMSLIPAIAWS